MEYTIGEIAKLMNLTVPTIRFYDKEGLLQNIKRSDSGIRKFNNNDIEILRMIACLKKTGMQLKDIKVFLDWCNEGDSTIEKRYQMFLEREKDVLKQIEEIESNLNLIKFKILYYEKAKKDGTENFIRNTKPEDMPKEARELYEKTH